jgi:DNA invertase Pin-like site-specific DNA recombinase
VKKLCKKLKATLVIAKLDRLSRDVHFITGLMKSGVEFVACDNPHANKMTLQMLAVFAEHERDMISKRTREALAALKAQGKRLGNPNPSTSLAKGRTRQASEARERAANVLPIIAELKALGNTTLQGIADGLNARNVATPRGGRWSPTTIARLLKRAA